MKGDQETEDIADIGQVLSEKEQSVVTEVVKNRNRLWIKLTEAPEDKNRRKVIHTFISNKFNNVITKTEDGFISVKFSPGQKDKRGRSPRVAWDNSKLGGNDDDILEFLISKGIDIIGTTLTFFS